jgi:hypothetical protein
LRIRSKEVSTMRILAAAIIGVAGLAASTQAANACDLEGFGFTRINPFAQHAAWSVPAEQNARQGDSESSQKTAAKDQPAPAEDNRKTAASQSFTPVSADASASQSQRFTATKD